MTIKPAQAIQLAKLYLDLATVWEDISSQAAGLSPVPAEPAVPTEPEPPAPQDGRGYWKDAPDAADLHAAMDMLVRRSGLTLSNLSSLSGFGKSSMARWGRGTSRIRKNNLARLNRVLMAYRLEPVADKNGEVHSV